jgi:hypothetical protein
MDLDWAFPRQFDENGYHANGIYIIGLDIPSLFFYEYVFILIEVAISRLM